MNNPKSGRDIYTHINHKPKTTKVFAWAKSLWDRYLTCDDLRPLSTIRACVTDSILSGIVSISVSIPINRSEPADFETWIEWILCTTKRKMQTISQIWKWLCQSYSIELRCPEQCRLI